MQSSAHHRVLQDILAPAGVTINGHNPWDIRVHNPRFFQRLFSGGSLALGESYMDGWWDCDALDQFFDRVLRHHLDERVRTGSPHMVWLWLQSQFANLQCGRASYLVGKRHYDIGNDLFGFMLDHRMIYSCAYWKDACSLDEAQEHKLDLICRKIGLEPGMTVLDIGCGWGGFARFAAGRYGAKVHGITVSNEQARYVRETCDGLDVTVELIDYRDIDRRFDRVVSIGMFEHVGYRHYRTYMETARRCLAPDGLFLLHTIGGNSSSKSTDPWIRKYIFPNSMLPSARQISAAAEGLFVMEDWHNFGAYYDTTLMCWYRNFLEHWDSLKGSYDQRFYRMWVYYLLSCAGSFRARRNQLWQVVLSPAGVKGRPYREQYLEPRYDQFQI